MELYFLMVLARLCGIMSSEEQDGKGRRSSEGRCLRMAWSLFNTCTLFWGGSWSLKGETEESMRGGGGWGGEGSQ